MNLKGFGLGLVAALACGSVFAQQDNQKHSDKAQKNLKPTNQADIDFQQRVIDASNAYKNGNKDEALKQFEQLYYRAVEQYLRGDLDAADQYAKEVSRLDPSSDAARQLRDKIDAARRYSR